MTPPGMRGGGGEGLYRTMGGGPADAQQLLLIQDLPVDQLTMEQADIGH